MCRNIKPLFNFDPPATDKEIHEASLQFVRKLSGFNKPSETNHHAFDRAVNDIAENAKLLLNSLETHTHPHNREEEAAKAHARAVKRFNLPA